MGGAYTELAEARAIVPLPGDEFVDRRHYYGEIGDRLSPGALAVAGVYIARIRNLDVNAAGRCYASDRPVSLLGVTPIGDNGDRVVRLVHMAIDKVREPEPEDIASLVMDKGGILRGDLDDPDALPDDMSAGWGYFLRWRNDYDAYL